MAHVHGFLPGELCLFEDLESREKKILLPPSLYRIVWLHKVHICEGEICIELHG